MTPSGGRPQVSVVVACTRPELIEGIARALAAESPVACELLVGGDVVGIEAPDLGVPTKVVPLDPRFLHRNRRLLVDHAGAPVVAFLDDDAVPLPGWLTTAATLPASSSEIWTGPERPTRTSAGATLAREVATSVLAEGHVAHVAARGRWVRWSEVPFCNLVVGRQFLDLVGLPDETLPWDLDDFDLCRRAARAGATFRSLPQLAIAHDRYPDRVAEWLGRKERERRRTGEKLVRYPDLYLRVPSVVAAASLPWAVAGGIAAARRRRVVSGVLVAVYLSVVTVESHRDGRHGRHALRFAAALVGLHTVSVASVQVGVLKGLAARVLGRPDPQSPDAQR